MPSINPEQLPLLQTKLYRPPATPELEQRTRLIERLERNRQRPLTLISAPAGYGKTMLASMWLDSCSCPNAWLSLDENDNDLQTFSSYLLAALRCAFSPLQLDTEALLEAPILPSVPTLARYMLNDLEQIQEPFILVLDDTHHIYEQSIFDLLAELLQHPAPNLHLVLIGRHDPKLQTASLRARSQVTEIRANELRFTAEETARLLSRMLDRQVDQATAAEWAQKTEGWVTALRLAALSLRHRGSEVDLRVSIQGDSRYLYDYLLAEVLVNLPSTYQAWLLKSAILERFCASLIETICRTKSDPVDMSGEAFIDWLVRENLFLVPLDDQRKWFRFHHLFKQLLYKMLESQVNPVEVVALRRRTSDWYTKNGLLDEALQHLLAAGDVQAAVHLVEQHRYELMNDEQWHRLERWLNLLSMETVAQTPFLMSAKAFLGIHRGRDRDVLGYLQEAERLLAMLPSVTPDVQVIQAESDVIQGIVDLVYGNTASATLRVQRSRQRLPSQALFVRCIANGTLAICLQMDGYFEQGVALIRKSFEDRSLSARLHARMAFYLCIIHFQEGDLTGILKLAPEFFELSETVQIRELAYNYSYFRGIAHYLRNELVQAKPNLLALLDDYALSSPSYLANGVFVLALIYLALDRASEAEQVIARIHNLLGEAKDTFAWAITQASRVELAFRQGKLAEARHLSQSIEFELRPPMWFFYVPQLTPIRLLLAEATPESLEEAHTRLDDLDEAMRVINRKNVRIDVLALLALVCEAQGDRLAAIGKLRKALELGVIGRNIRSFVDLSTPMANLLQRMKGEELSKEHTRYIDQILAAFSKEELAERAETQKISHRPQIQQIEPLTRRERQVLQLLVGDLPMQEIAAELVISTNTLHTHTKNIYAKMGVNRRAQAVQRAIELDLV